VTPLLSVKNLKTTFRSDDGIVSAVNGLSFSVEAGSTLGIVGESGSGKSVTALSIMRLVPQPQGKIETGEIFFKGHDLLKKSDAEMRAIRGHEIAMIFQDPMTSLNPVLTVGDQIAEATRLHLGLSKKDALDKAVEMLRVVRLPVPEKRIRDYPHQFSGGMRQRIAIAIALICGPGLLIADEPTTALDVTVQAGIIGLLDRLRKDVGLSVLLITHDLGVMSSIADVISVMYAGRIVESGATRDVIQNARHPYTRGLLDALPHPEETGERPLVAIPGQPPSARERPPGCAFHPRCSFALESCRTEVPPLIDVGSRLLACPPDPLVGAR
jgi:oligopeptide/dipeptide ABC transporter ATP-binding protein